MSIKKEAFASYSPVNICSIESNKIIITPIPVDESIDIVFFSIFSSLSLYFCSLDLACKLETVLEKVINCSCFLS